MTVLLRTAAAVALITALCAPAAHAHRMWLVPSSTVVSGADPWVTVDGAISNTLFFPDHNPMRLDGVKVIGPDGQPVAIENGVTGKYRSTFDIHLTKPGTYKIVNGGGTGDMLSASYKVGTETKRWRGTAAELKTAIPAGAKEVEVSTNSRRGEAFVTAGAPTLAALKPTGEGLELEPITHPNDLVAGEAAKFRLLLNGKPAANVDVTVARGQSRYRADPGDLKIKTGADGVLAITWPEAGMYWIEAAVRGTPDASGVSHNAGYTATFEVLPQ